MLGEVESREGRRGTGATGVERRWPALPLLGWQAGMPSGGGECRKRKGAGTGSACMASPPQSTGGRPSAPNEEAVVEV